MDTGTEKIWAAAGRFDVAVGDRVRVSLDMPMENFHSETLKRDFPLIYFAEGIEKEGAPGRAPAGPAVVFVPAPVYGKCRARRHGARATRLRAYAGDGLRRA